MEFGMFHEFQRLPGASEPRPSPTRWPRSTRRSGWGLDAMWLAELHFNPERSVLASPLILATAIAARTTRMKIGTAVQVLPLCHPLRLAEELATVDQLSNGRLIFGAGRSGFAHTYKTYGVDYGESRERFSETLDIVKRAFTEERFSHTGQVLHLRQRPPGAAPDPAAVARDPRRRRQPRHLRGDGHDGPSDLRRGAHRQPLRPGAEREDLPRGVGGAGHPGRGAVYLRVPVYVADTDEAAREEPRESILHLLRTIGANLAASANLGQRPRDREPRRARRQDDVDRLRGGAARAHDRRHAAKVIARLKQLEEQLGLDGILAELNPGSRIPHTQVMTALRLLCEEVIPAFK